MVLAVLAPPALAADPVEVTYDDAIECASLDTVLAGVLGAEKDQSDEDKAQAKYYTDMAEKWLSQAVDAHPGGQDAAFADFDKAVEALSDRMVAAKSEDEVSAIIRPSIEKCSRLEEAAYGGPNGIVD